MARKAEKPKKNSATYSRQISRASESRLTIWIKLMRINKQSYWNSGKIKTQKRNSEQKPNIQNTKY